MRIFLYFLVVVGVVGSTYWMTQNNNSARADDKEVDFTDQTLPVASKISDHSQPTATPQKLETRYDTISQSSISSSTKKAARPLQIASSTPSEEFANNSDLEINQDSELMTEQEPQQDLASNENDWQSTSKLLPSSKELQLGLHVKESAAKICDFEYCLPLGRDGVLISGVQYQIGQTKPFHSAKLSMGSWIASSPLVYVGLD